MASDATVGTAMINEGPAVYIPADTMLGGEHSCCAPHSKMCVSVTCDIPAAAGKVLLLPVLPTIRRVLQQVVSVPGYRVAYPCSL